MEVVQFEKGSVIFREGDHEYCMYEILSGRVEIISGFGTVNEKILTELEDGRVFGELALCDYLPRSATAVAESTVEARRIEADELQSYAKDHPEIMKLMLLAVVRRIRELSADYEEICQDISEYYHYSEQDVPKSLLERLKAFIKETNEIMASNQEIMNEYYSHFIMM